MLHALVAGSLLGFASLPHCTVMCGPLSALACARARARSSTLRYQLGRTLGYTFAGWLCGQLGLVLGTLAPPVPLTIAFSVLSAAACVVLALKLLAPARTTSLASLVPLGIAPRSRGVLERIAHVLPREPAALGALSVLLPCGVLGAALLASVATASATSGALLMLGFVSASGVALVCAALLSRLLADGTRWLRGAVAASLVLSAALLVATPVRAFLAIAPDPAAQHCH